MWPWRVVTNEQAPPAPTVAAPTPPGPSSSTSDPVPDAVDTPSPSSPPLATPALPAPAPAPAPAAGATVALRAEGNTCMRRGYTHPLPSSSPAASADARNASTAGLTRGVPRRPYSPSPQLSTLPALVSTSCVGATPQHAGGVCDVAALHRAAPPARHHAARLTMCVSPHATAETPPSPSIRAFVTRVGTSTCFV